MWIKVRTPVSPGDEARSLMWIGHGELCGILGIGAEGQRDEAMFDIYQSRRRPQYELVVPTNIETYDRWNGDWRRIRTTENPRREEQDTISTGETGIYAKKWTRS
jgi:hypothetical protein